MIPYRTESLAFLVLMNSATKHRSPEDQARLCPGVPAARAVEYSPSQTRSPQKRGLKDYLLYSVWGGFLSKSMLYPKTLIILVLILKAPIL